MMLILHVFLPCFFSMFLLHAVYAQPAQLSSHSITLFVFPENIVKTRASGIIIGSRGEFFLKPLNTQHAFPLIYDVLRMRVQGFAVSVQRDILDIKGGNPHDMRLRKDMSLKRT